MKNLIFPLIGLLGAVSGASGGILLNEVHLNVPDSDGNYEFVELRSTTGGVESCAGLTLLIINNDVVDADTGTALNPGKLEEALDLSELSTGANGLLILGNQYNDSPRGGPWSSFVDPLTEVGDPAGLGNSDLDSNDGMTVILVRDFKPVEGKDIQEMDVDTDNDGVIDWLEVTPPATAPEPMWTAANQLDSIGFRDRDVAVGGAGTPYTSANVSAAPVNYAKDPDTMARKLDNNTPNAALSWYGGKLAEGPKDTTVYQIGDTFGFVGEVTPGRTNLAAQATDATFVINEVGLNPPGSDAGADRFQYIEILNTSATGSKARSLYGYWLVVVDSEDDSGDGVGGIMEEWDLSSFATGSNGLLLLGDGYTPGSNPFQDLVDPLTSMGDPAARAQSGSGTSLVQASTGWALGDLGKKDGFSLFLIRRYAPASVAADIDSNNDGTVNSATALTVGGGTLVDQVGFNQAGKTLAGKTYSTGVNLRPVMAAAMTAPENLSRKLGSNTPGNSLTNVPAAVSAWYGGVYGSDAQAMTVGFATSAGTTNGATFFGGFRGAGTPGRANLAAAIDPASPPVAAGVRISEVMADPTGTPDGAREYIELESTNQSMAYLDGLWVLIVDTNGAASGAVVDSFPLDGMNTGLNGMAIIGDNYDAALTYPYRNTEGNLPPGTAVFDPDVAIGGNDIPNSGFAILITRGVKGPLTLSGGKAVGDIDADNDGVFDAAATYTDELVDSIVVATRSPGAGYAWIDSTPFLPSHVARLPRSFAANTAAGWYYGQVSQAEATNPSTEYTGSFAGPFKGAASPGRMNHGAPTGPVDVGAVVINELNPAGADKNFEFIELLSTAGANRSLNRYSVVVVDNTGPNTGAIRHAWSLDGYATGANGLFLLGSRYDQTGENGNPFAAVTRGQTLAGDPPGRDGLDSSLFDFIIGRETDNLSITLLLVRDFSRYIDYDMDVAVGADPTGSASQGDGILETSAWTGGLHDSLMLLDFLGYALPPAADTQYAPFDGFRYSNFADLTTRFFFPNPPVAGKLVPVGYYHPESIARFRGENTPNSAAAWYAGDLVGGVSGGSGTALDYEAGVIVGTNPPVPTGFQGYVTPGQPNLVRAETTDTDGDGQSGLREEAMGSNPFSAASTSPDPVATVITEGSNSYLGFTYTRIKGGVAAGSESYSAEAYTYTLEASSDLVTWTSLGTQFVPVDTTANPDGVTETARVRLALPASAVQLRQFTRVRIGRR